MGVESIDQKTLNTMRTSFNRARALELVVQALHRHNISYSCNFVVGSDTEDDDASRTTLRSLLDHRIHAAYFNIMIPLRGTFLYETMKTEGRLLDEEQTERWPGLSCHFKPLRLP